MEKKRLYRIKKNAMFTGVCQGIGEYFEVDPTVIRLLWVVISIFGTIGIGGIVIYLICTCIIPLKPTKDTFNDESTFDNEDFHVKDE